VIYSLRFFANAIGAHGTISARSVATRLGFTSAISLLKVMTFPRQPVMVSPLGGATGIKNVELSWNDPGIPNYNKATRYHVTLSPGNFVSDVVPPSTNVTLSEVLFFDNSYVWTAQAINDHGASVVSSANFRTPPPPSPTYLSPNNDTSIIPVIFNWVDVGAQMGSPALQFEIVLSGNFPEGVSGPQTWVTQQGNFTCPIALLFGAPYTWQLRGEYANAGYGSPVNAAFTTDSG
jgi:hypothetical protein